ncbi:MAG: ABC transporter permease [Saprospiraceae bacterium]
MNKQSSHPQPPQWADKFLEWYCSPFCREEIQGDLHEAFHRRRKQFSLRKAERLFVWEVLLSFRWSNMRSVGNSPGAGWMSTYRLYFKIAWRNMLKAKTFSSINIAGLTIGLATCILIFQFIHSELSFDQFHIYKSDLYRVELDRIYADRTDKSAGCTAFLGPALAEYFPEVEAYTKLWGTKHVNNVLHYDQDPLLVEQLYYADSNFFELFTFRLIEGDPHTALLEPFSIVLTQSVARKLFGNTPAMGKTIRYSGNYGTDDYQVTGIAQDPPYNTHLPFSTLISFKTLIEQTDERADRSTGWNAFLTYLKLKDGTPQATLEAKLHAFIDQYYADLQEKDVQVQLYLQPITSIHLHSNIRFEPDTNGSFKVVKILGWVAVFILIIAWVNYINLATSKAIERAKEVGVLKVIGAHKRDLRRQFLIESTLLNLCSLVFAISIAWLAIPLLNQITQSDISPVAFLNSPEMIFGLTGVFVLGILLSGFYPAFVMASFSPASALGGTIRWTKGLNLRKALVMVQFAISVILIAGSLVVFKQVNFMLHNDIGMNIRQIMVLQGPSLLDSTYPSRLANLKNQLLSFNYVDQVTNSTAIPGKEITWINNGVRRSGQPESSNQSIPFIGVEHEFFKTYQLPLVAGRTFRKDGEEENDKVVLTKSAASQLGFADAKSALNQTISFNDRKTEVIGVVADYHQESLNHGYQPILFLRAEQANSYFSIKLTGFNTNEAIRTIRQVWNESFPGNPFSYFFQDEYFDRQYRADRLFGKLMAMFTGLAILIACLGLFGLTAFTMQKRRKEIGIRKVLGASTHQILINLTREHMTLVFAAALIGAPVAYVLMQNWLNHYAFAITLKWWYFLLPLLMLAMAGAIAVGFHAIKAAVANPVNSIRSAE